MIKNKFEVKFRARLGEDKKDDKSVSILNRVLEWVDGVGVMYEADQRHAEMMVKDLGLENSKPVVTPGEVERGELET